MLDLSTLENIIMLGVSHSSHQGLQIKSLIPVAMCAKNTKDKEESRNLMLLLDIS